MSANQDHNGRGDGFARGLEDWVSKSPAERQEIRAAMEARRPAGAPRRSAALAIVAGDLPRGAILVAIRESAASDRPLLITTERHLDDRTFYAGIAALSWDESRVPNPTEQRIVRVMPGGEMISESDGATEKVETASPDANDARRVVGLLKQAATNVSNIELPVFGKARLFEF